ncbi:MAG: hypothetical protein WC845_00865 [Candidatus Staskawiczbacteria bacterium]
MILSVPEGIIMLITALILDGCGLVLFVLSLFGIGIPFSFLLDLAGATSIGIFTLTSGIVKNAVGNIAGKAGEAMAGSNGGEEGAAGKAGNMATGVAKKGARVGLGITRFIITFFIELIPFIGDIFPTWTLCVIFTLIEEQALS